MARLHGPLRIEEVLDDTGRLSLREGRPTWRLLEPLEWRFDDYRGDFALIVPAGFVTDLASVPWIARRWIPSSGPWQRAAVLHDWVYAQKGVVTVCLPYLQQACLTETWTREQADQLFLDAMHAAGVGWWTRHAMHAAVRLGGAGGWGR